MTAFELPEGITSEEGLAVLRALQSRFGWVGIMINRDDAAAILDRDITDEEWNRLCTSEEWRSIGDYLDECVFQLACDAVEGVLD